MIRKRTLILGLSLVFVFIVAGCRATVKTVAPGENIQYSAEYGYGDLKVLSAEMANRILKTKVASENPAAVMIIYGIENRTDEHIDTRALADAIRNDLLKSGKLQFVNEAQRKKLEGEIAYQKQGYITQDSMIQIGKQIGAKYMLTGTLVSITADQLRQVRVKAKSLKYYRLTLEITDINTNLIVWTDEQEIVREQAKPFIGW